MFNLITTPWLPIHRASGARAVIAPHEVTEGFEADPVLALDFGRPDFDGAVSEFLIGLLSVACAPQDLGDWTEAWLRPPEPARLQQALAPLAFAFDLEGEGPRCFQDLDPLADCEELALRQLLIEAPGANTLRNNADLFQKRGSLDFTPAETAAALITLQCYAPSGGAGHRTSLRGGGPLTTLLTLARLRAGAPLLTLWDRLWPNVLDREEPAPALDAALFPWLGPTRTSTKGEVTTEGQVHRLQAFFACPRRIRLVFDAEGRPQGYRTRNYGTNYSQWLHPLSPYYDSKQEKLPRHPQSGPASYRDWLGILAGDAEQDLVAEVVSLGNDRLEELPYLAEGAEARPSVLAFGYDMDNMKARGWVQQEVPFHPVLKDDLDAFRAHLRDAVGAAREAARQLRYAVRLARFGRETAEGGVELPPDLNPEAGREAALALWAESEPAFRDLLQSRAVRGAGGWQETRVAFFKELKMCAVRIFNAEVDDAALVDRYPARLVRARQALRLAFEQRGSGKQKGSACAVWKALGLAPLPPVREKAA